MASEDVDPAGQKKTCSDRCDEISKTIWNSDKKEFLGRTAKSWGTLFVTVSDSVSVIRGVPLTTAKGKILNLLISA